MEFFLLKGVRNTCNSRLDGYSAAHDWSAGVAQG